MRMLQPREQAGRHMGWPAFIGVVIVYAAIIQGVGLAAGVDTGGYEAQFPTAESVTRNGLIPIGLSVIFAIGVTAWLGWWREVLWCDVPVRRWVRIVPISMLAAAVIAVNYPRLADQPAGLVLAVAIMTLLVGIGEELMFRGLGVNVFRRAGFSEGRVALWSSVIFGAVHLTNAIGAGPQAILQAAVVATSGYFFYLCLRVGGVILLPMLVHGLWDFSLISNLIGAEDLDPYVGPVLIIAVQVGLIVLLVVRRRRIEPVTPG
ncbi:MAG: CPBP family intramembrane glutamic endopeptidase [Thermoleophilia bacterium]